MVELYFGNSPKGALLIKKIDSVSREPLSDVEFFVTTSDGTVVGNANGKFVTDSAGTVLIENIDPGMTLVVKETRTFWMIRLRLPASRPVRRSLWSSATSPRATSSSTSRIP